VLVKRPWPPATLSPLLAPVSLRSAALHGGCDDALLRRPLLNLTAAHPARVRGQRRARAHTATQSAGSQHRNETLIPERGARVLIGWPNGLRRSKPEVSRLRSQQTVWPADQNSRKWSAPRSGGTLRFIAWLWAAARRSSGARRARARAAARAPPSEARSIEY
jgi:hypothetical protein